MPKLFVVDTMAIISYFSNVFGQGTRISKRGLSIIGQAFDFPDEVLLTVPGIVFVEIFDKWFRGVRDQDDEFRAMFRAEVLDRIRNAPNIEIREVDVETLKAFLWLEDPSINLENSDRLILASAAVLRAPLITADPVVIDFVTKHGVIPEVIR